MTQRDRIMLCVIGAVAVLAASWMLAIKPKREEAATLADQATAAQQRLDAANAALATAKQARAGFASAQESVARMGKAVPANDDVATLVYQLERSARRADIDFRTIDLSSASGSTATTNPDGSPNGVTNVPFSMTFEGDFFQLRRFLTMLRSFATVKGDDIKARGRLLSVEGVSLAAARQDFPMIKATISATAYTAPAPKASASVDASAGAATPAAPDAGSATGAPSTPATATGVAR